MIRAFCNLAIVRRFYARWNQFFFERSAMPIVGIFRICYATLCGINMLCLLPYLEVWFTENGAMPLSAARELLDEDALMPLSWIPGTPLVVSTCYSVMMAQIVLLLIGFRTRFQATCLFFWLIAFQHRNTILFDGEDTLFRLLAFYLIWLPAGRYYALDARNERRPPSERTSALWPLRLVQIQLTLIYASTCAEKLLGTDWLNGTALYYVSRLDDLFGRFPLPAVVFDSLPFLRAASWSVLVLEALIPICLWIPRTRRYTIIVAVLFHLSIDYSMNLNLFHPLMICTLLTFIPWNSSAPKPEHAYQATTSAVSA